VMLHLNQYRHFKGFKKYLHILGLKSSVFNKF
jgi:hypothetical protein